LFAPIKKPSFNGKSGRCRVSATASSNALVQKRDKITTDGRLRVGRLWDVLGENRCWGWLFTVPSNWRRVAHIVSARSGITGEDCGSFISGWDRRWRSQTSGDLDQDGENHRFPPTARSVVDPRFSPTQEITYLSYYKGVPRVYLQH
jgi:TolB protein